MIDGNPFTGPRIAFDVQYAFSIDVGMQHGTTYMHASHHSVLGRDESQ